MTNSCVAVVIIQDLCQIVCSYIRQNDLLKLFTLDRRYKSIFKTLGIIRLYYLAPAILLNIKHNIISLITINYKP